ncbi:MAG TPA: SRPBCC family protein, partial [Gemmatimonadaceae bacterium]
MATQQTIEGNGARAEPGRRAPARAGTRDAQFADREVKPAPWHSSEFVASEKDPVTNFLGWFSIGLGLAEVFAPQAVARLIGIDEEEHKTLLRAYGVRELAAGFGILTRPKPTYWMWNRVIGDAIDLRSLQNAMSSDGNDNSRLKMAALAVAGVTALDIVSSMRLTSEASPAAGEDPGSYKTADTEVDNVVAAVVTVNKPIEEVYDFWKDPRNYAEFMDQIESVNPTTGGRSRWKVKAPPGLSVEFDAHVVNDVPNELIRWSSVDSDEVDSTGTVRFQRAAGNRGTIVTLDIEYKPKGGPLGAKIGKLFSAIPKTQLQNDLRRFKQ